MQGGEENFARASRGERLPEHRAQPTNTMTSLPVAQKQLTVHTALLYKGSRLSTAAHFESTERVHGQESCILCIVKQACIQKLRRSCRIWSRVLTTVVYRWGCIAF